MKKYKVHISEIYSKDIVVEAESEEQAEEIAEEAACNDAILFNDAYFGERNIEVLSEASKKDCSDLPLVKIPGTETPWKEELLIVAIDVNDDGKIIKYLGYGYEVPHDKEKPYRFVEYSWFSELLEYVLKVGIGYYESKESENIKQGIKECTEKEIGDIYFTYDNGYCPKFIETEDVNLDTPCGVYIYFNCNSDFVVNKTIIIN